MNVAAVGDRRLYPLGVGTDRRVGERGTLRLQQTCPGRRAVEQPPRTVRLHRTASDMSTNHAVNDPMQSRNESGLREGRAGDMKVTPQKGATPFDCDNCVEAASAMQVALSRSRHLAVSSQPVLLGGRERLSSRGIDRSNLGRQRLALVAARGPNAAQFLHVLARDRSVASDAGVGAAQHLSLVRGHGERCVGMGRRRRPHHRGRTAAVHGAGGGHPAIDDAAIDGFRRRRVGCARRLHRTRPDRRRLRLENDSRALWRGRMFEAAYLPGEDQDDDQTQSSADAKAPVRAPG